MTSNKDKLINAIAKLIKLTQEGKLIWETAGANHSFTPKEADIIFFVEHKNKLLRLYEKEILRSRGASIGSIVSGSIVSGTAMGLGLEDFQDYPAIITKFEIINERGSSLWTFPEIDVLDDLMSAVKYQVSGAGNFVDDVLSDEPS